MSAGREDRAGVRGGPERTEDGRARDRAHKRLMVRYGVEAPDKTAFTRNLSAAGMCLSTNAVFKPGTTLQLEIRTQEKTFSQWARVIWAKKVPPQLAHLLDCGMGLCFLEPGPDWIEFCDGPAGTPGKP